MERLKELLKQSPEDAFVRFALAKEMEKSGDVAEAINGLQSLLEDNPEYVGAYYHLAAMLVAAGEGERAFEIYDRGIEQASRVGDQHALAELKNARLNLELETE